MREQCSLGSRLSAAFILLACLAPGITFGQDCTAHYSFDGTLGDQQGGHDGMMISIDGGSAVPEFVPGQSGQALVLGERAVMRAFVDLHPDTCPELTISAWLRVDPSDTESRVVVSSGNQQSPGLRVSGGTLTANGPGNGLSESSVFRPQGGWTLVAGVYNFRRGTYTLHWRSRSKTIELTDRWRPPEEAIWIGAMNDQLAHPANRIVIDDLRITPRTLDTQQIVALHRGDDMPISSPDVAFSSAANDTVDAAADAGGAEWQGMACASHAECGTGNYCGYDDRCHPDLHAPRRDLTVGTVPPSLVDGLPSSEANSGSGATLESMRERNRDLLSPETQTDIDERVQENRPPSLEYESEEAALEAQREREARARENEQLPATAINAVLDLQTLTVRDSFERNGDEYYLVRYPLRGRLGTGDRIYTFDYGEQVWPLASGEDWARPETTFSIPQGAGRFTFNNVAPYEVYGFVAVLMEANNNRVDERTYAFGFGEFQNESGVTEVISSAFARAVPREVAPPDYDDTRCANITNIFGTIRAGIYSQFGDYRDTRRGLAEAIRVALIAPLQRNNRDRLAGVMWAFAMNTPGGSRGQACLGQFDPTLFPQPGSPMRFDHTYTHITGEHRR